MFWSVYSQPVSFLNTSQKKKKKRKGKEKKQLFLPTHFSSLSLKTYIEKSIWSKQQRDRIDGDRHIGNISLPKYFV